MSVSSKVTQCCGFLRSLSSSREPIVINNNESITFPNGWMLDLMIDSNKIANQTRSYEQEALIVRRGNVIKFRLKANDPVYLSQVRLEISTSNVPTVQRGTLQNLQLEHDTKRDINEMIWDAVTTKAEDPKELNIHLSVPCNACIGRWSITVYDNNIKKAFTKMYVIANPFDPAGGCFYDGSYDGVSPNDFLGEYLKSEEGCVWKGSDNSPICKRWTFDQFRAPFLDCACNLLARANMEGSGTNLHDLTDVVRILSAQLNAKGDNGVMECKWSSAKGSYDAGKSPSYWDSSYDIMKQYYDTGKPTKFGQCWVMSGLMTAFVRCLGIPARSITTYSSAYDMDNTLTIDTYVDENGNRIDCPDFVWNYHVWCEMWLNRPDLPEGSGGWNCSDSCPVIARASIHACGPASLNAIKNGDTYLGFDTGFMYSCVNADSAKWLVKQDKNGKMTILDLISRGKSWIGKKIVTKAIGENKYGVKDITLEYKYAEGSPEERASWNRAVRYVGHRSDTRRTKMQDELLAKAKDYIYTIDIKPPTNATTYGESIALTLRIDSKKLFGKNIQLVGQPKLVLSSVFQSGEIFQAFHHLDLDFGDISPATDKVFEINKDKYEGCLAPDDGGAVRADVIARVTAEDGHIETIGAQCDFIIRQPEDGIVLIKVSAESVDIGKSLESTVTVTNTSKQCMRDIKLTINTSADMSFKTGWTSTKTGRLQLKRTQLKPQESFSQTFTVSFKRAGFCRLAAHLDSDVIKNVTHNTTVHVQDIKADKNQYFWV